MGDYFGEAVSRTAFAEKAAPPESGMQFGIGALLCMLIAASIYESFDEPSRGWLTFWWATVVLPAFTIWRLIKLPDHFRKKAIWNQSWICKRSRTRF